MAHFQLQAEDIFWQVDNHSIVDGVSLSVKKGETFGIVGPNGAGKTSLLKCLYKEHTLSSGNITLGDIPLNYLSRREVAKQVAVVGQQHDAVFNLTVLDIVNMGLIPHKDFFERNTDQDRQLLNQAIEKVDLLAKKHQTFNTLSGGEQQRCLIARAIVQRPDILIMDEPTNHLDIFYQHQILSIVKDLGLTLIMTIHDLNLAAQYCDRLLLISSGKVIACDVPEKVLSAPLLKSVFHLGCQIDTNPLTNKIRVTYGSIGSGAAL